MSLFERLSPGIASQLDHSGFSDDPLMDPCGPTPLESPEFLAVSPQAAALLNVSAQDLQSDPQALAILSGSFSPSEVPSYASVYAGHQFGVFVPRLGDGRALNLGAIDGWELQLKGAGPTRYSRFADGRAVLRSSIREFLCSEAMHALGVPTTRALSLIHSPTPVVRETIETAAVVCRLAPNFLRFGHFEYFAHQQKLPQIEALVRAAWPAMWSRTAHASHLIQSAVFDANRHQEAITEAANLPMDQLCAHLLEETSRRTARLMAQWMSLGFMHGVMNTDNFSILGLTIDYGPFGWMDAFNAHHICNHSDHSGRYSYQAQPQIGLWNIGRLAGALDDLVKTRRTQSSQSSEWFMPAIEAYRSSYATTLQSMLREKFGLNGLDEDTWSALLDDFYSLMHEQSLDYTLVFRSLSSDDDSQFMAHVVDREAAKPWLARYRAAVKASLQAEQKSKADRAAAMNRANPKFVLRNWVAEEVIQDCKEASQKQPSKKLQEVMTVLAAPFDEHETLARYSMPPPEWAVNLEVSCSS